MKKKFVLTSALVLIVVASLVAATPVEVSGKFKAGYTFTFNDPAEPAVKPVAGNSASIKAAFEGDFWEVSIAGDLQYGADKGLDAATAKILLSDALAAEGVDLGDFTIALHVGTGVAKGAPSVYADKGGFDNMGVVMAEAFNSGISLGYGKLVEVYFAAFPSKAFPMVVGVKSTPVDGVSVAAGYSNEADAVNASVSVDVKKLADLEFALAATAGYRFDLGNDIHLIAADVAGGYAGATAFVAYQTNLTFHKLVADVGYKYEGDGFNAGAGVKVTFADLTDVANNKPVIALRADADYKFGGVTYALAAGYTVNGAITVTPSASLSF